MGADIHSYVEYSQREYDSKPFWKNFTTNNGERNYVMFGVLAGVRVPEAQLFEPKGMPDGDLGYDTAGGYWLHVAPENHPEWADGDNWVTRKNAERYVERGYSVAQYDDKGVLKRVSGPDWHSHSWLTAAELEAALEHYKKKVCEFYPQENPTAPPEWIATLAAMRSFEASGCKTRLVFWFDN